MSVSMVATAVALSCCRQRWTLSSGTTAPSAPGGACGARWRPGSARKRPAASCDGYRPNRAGRSRSTLMYGCIKRQSWCTCCTCSCLGALPAMLRAVCVRLGVNVPRLVPSTGRPHQGLQLRRPLVGVPRSLSCSLLRDSVIRNDDRMACSPRQRRRTTAERATRR